MDGFDELVQLIVIFALTYAGAYIVASVFY
jgi:hypothetical protein